MANFLSMAVLAEGREFRIGKARQNLLEFSDATFPIDEP